MGVLNVEPFIVNFIYNRETANYLRKRFTFLKDKGSILHKFWSWFVSYLFDLFAHVSTIMQLNAEDFWISSKTSTNECVLSGPSTFPNCLHIMWIDNNSWNYGNIYSCWLWLLSAACLTLGCLRSLRNFWKTHWLST